MSYIYCFISQDEKIEGKVYYSYLDLIKKNGPIFKRNPHL